MDPLKEYGILPAPLRFPAPPGCLEPAVWTGNGFLVDGRTASILSYATGSFAWNDELTEIHEEVAGDDHYIDRASREHAAAQLRLWLGERSAVVMDIGCSSGFFLKLLKRRFPYWTVVGSDCVCGPLERLSAEMPGVPLLQLDLSQSPLPDRTFDALVLLNVLEHIEDDVGAMRQVYRMLQPGGIAVIEVPAGPGLYDVYDQELLHFRRYRMRPLLEQLRSVGFEILTRSHLGFFLYPGFWVVKKRNRKYLKASREVQREVVKENIRRSSNNDVMHLIMKGESELRRWIYFPVGIRCLVTCRRPAL